MGGCLRIRIRCVFISPLSSPSLSAQMDASWSFTMPLVMNKPNPLPPPFCNNDKGGRYGYDENMLMVRVGLTCNLFGLICTPSWNSRPRSSFDKPAPQSLTEMVTTSSESKGKGVVQASNAANEVLIDIVYVYLVGIDIVCACLVVAVNRCPRSQ